MADIKEKIEKGYIQSKLIVEIVGKPKEHVKKTAELYLDNIKKDNTLEIISSDSAEINELKDLDGFFGTFLDLELLFPSLNSLAGFCFDYMPSSVEIIAPTNFTFKASEMSSFMNELQTKLHSLDMMIKKIKSENDFLRKNTNQLLTNVVNLMLINSDHSAQELGKTIGLPQDQMKDFLDKLVEQKKLSKQGDKYQLVKDDQREKQD